MTLDALRAQAESLYDKWLRCRSGKEQVRQEWRKVMRAIAKLEGTSKVKHRGQEPLAGNTMITCALCGFGPVSKLYGRCQECGGVEYDEDGDEPRCGECDGEGSWYLHPTCKCPLMPAGEHPEDWGRWEQEAILDWLCELQEGVR